MGGKTLQDFVLDVFIAGCRVYITNAPWSFGRVFVYRQYRKHLDWRSRKIVGRTLFGDRMELSLSDVVCSTIYVSGQWESTITKYVRDNLQKGEVFIDVGANVGYYTLLASRLVQNSGKVHAIEASQTNFTSLARNLALNACQNVTCILGAASDAAGELPIYLAQSGNPGHSTTVERVAKDESMQLEGRVRADTIEALVGSDALFSARIVKIDVEGAELAVLRPLFRNLARFSMKTEFLLELSPLYCPGGQSDIDEIFREFRSGGFEMFELPNGYSEAQLISRPKKPTFQALISAPTAQIDVLVTRRRRPASDQ